MYSCYTDERERYPKSLKDYSGAILLVGISYEKTKEHKCLIESYKKVVDFSDFEVYIINKK